MLINYTASGQFSSKKFKPKHEAYTDSLKQVEYNYVFPFWGQGAYKKGFDIPYPAGIMANFMWLKQGVVIDNMQLGIKTDEKDIPLTPVDFIEFGDNTNVTYTMNVRPDLWIFPFLNVYGIFGYGTSSMEVNLTAPIELKSVVDQSIATYGFGVLGAFGVGPVWMSVDANFTWNKPELLEKSVPVNVLGVRIGHTFKFKQRPDRNFAVWVGAMRASMGAETVGEIKLSDALSQETWERRDEIVQEYGDWYDGLSLAKQKIVDKTAIPDIIDGLENSDGSSIIRYGMDKQVKQMWNGLLGAQFQINKHWMFRAEGGLIGDRKSFLFSVNYRFLV
jgi:hypothetical protein